MIEHTITKLRQLLEADSRARETERAWHSDPSVETLRAFLGMAQREGKRPVVDLSDLTKEMVADTAISTMLSKLPIRQFTHEDHPLTNLIPGIRTLLLNRRIFMAPIPNEQGPGLTPVRIRLVAYNPSSTKNRFIIVAIGAKGENARGPGNLGATVHYAGSWDANLWTGASSKEGDKHMIRVSGGFNASRLKQMFSLGKSSVVVYHDAADSNIASLVRSL